ncbi:MAG: aminotransferase class IV [Balneolaceae bacterium]|nr:aminotransferase class IV [Balneolaceae bacterium]
MSKPDNYVNLNGSIVLQENALIPAFHSGLFYGAGCFETLRAEQGKLFRFREHTDRLKRGLIYLGVPEKLLPDPNNLLNDISELLRKNSLQSDLARVRIQFSLNEKPGYGRDENLSLIKLINCSRIDSELKPLKLKVSDVRTVPNRSRPADLKLSNMLHYRAAYREARDAGFDDGLMLNQNGLIAETSISNIFWKRNGVIYTPSSETDILPGIMRNEVISIVNELTDYRMNIGNFTIEELKSAESIWITNSVKEICPVQSVEDLKFNVDDDFINKLREKMKVGKSGENS